MEIIQTMFNSSIATTSDTGPSFDSIFDPMFYEHLVQKSSPFLQHISQYSNITLFDTQVTTLGKFEGSGGGGLKTNKHRFGARGTNTLLGELRIVLSHNTFGFFPKSTGLRLFGSQ